MNPKDPNLAKVELIAHVLGSLRNELVLVGGCAAGLLMTDMGAAPARVTYDVDLLVEVAALIRYHEVEAEFVRLGFQRDMTAQAPICRWRYNDLAVDLMPTVPGILGFANRWYPMAVATAEERMLPSGLVIRLISAPLFIATKFEAFDDRGNQDLLTSHDLEDIINVVDGRPELPAEIGSTPGELRDYLADQCAALLAMPNFMNCLPGILFQDEILAERMATVAHRLNQIATQRNKP